MENLKIVDPSLPVTVKPVDKDYRSNLTPHYYLIMGPTGAGKSSFIEALAGEARNFSISKDQLSGYTQHVTEYRLVNATTRGGSPIHIIDTPGFADTNISEVEIIGMINKWLLEHDLDEDGVDHLFFLTPITEPRLAGSKRRTIAMIQEFLSACGALRAITFVTTMWDTLHNQRVQNRAESNFQQLCEKDGILKDFPKAQIVRFMNTQTSALEIIGLGDRIGYVFDEDQPDLSESLHLYRDLYQRIEGSLQEKKNVEFDLVQARTKTNVELKAILERSHIANEEILTKFIKQFASMQKPPSQFGLDDAYQRLKEEIEILESKALISAPDAPAIPSSTIAPSANSVTNVQLADLVAESRSQPQEQSTQLSSKLNVAPQSVQLPGSQLKASHQENVPAAPDTNTLESKTLISAPDGPSIPSSIHNPSIHSIANIHPDDFVAEPRSQPQEESMEPIQLPESQPKVSHTENVPEAPDSGAVTEPQPKASRLLALKRFILRFIVNAKVRGRRLFRLKA